MKKSGIRCYICLVSVLFVIMAMFLTIPPATAQSQIRPGGTYTVNVTLHKPSDMVLDAGTWEVRAYFYSSTNCFNTQGRVEDDWWQPTGATYYLYTGWWTPRYPAYGAKYSDKWATPDEKVIPALTIQVLSENTTSPDGQNTMRPPDNNSSITLRARLRIKNIKFTRDGDYVRFTLGGKTYSPKISREYAGTIYLEGGGKLSIADQELDVDKDTPITATTDAPATGPFSVSVEIPSWPVAGFEIPVLPVVGGVVVLLVVVIVVVVVLKKRGGAEVPLPPPPPPSL